jgi:hypothetical protein
MLNFKLFSKQKTNKQIAKRSNKQINSKEVEKLKEV